MKSWLHHDAEARVRLGDALHLVQSLPHVEEVLQRAQAGDVVERPRAEGERLPCPDRDLRGGRDLLREADRLIGEIDAHRLHTTLVRRRQQRAGTTADVEQPAAGRCAEEIQKDGIRRIGTHRLQSLRGIVLVVPGLDVAGTEVGHGWLEE